jgi:hypothetical protein
MATHFARGGRRRRVLNDEARTAAGLHATVVMSNHDQAEAPRYGEMASIEHHPQITDYVPRRKRAMLATLAGAAAVAVGGQALVHFAPQAEGALPGVATRDLAAQVAGGLTAWTSAVALLAIAGLARLVLSLRRHRVDDVHGRYRVWKWVAAGALAGSVNVVVGVQTIVASAATAATGWSLTAGGAEWWLAPLALVGGWIAVRMMLEIAESRPSLTMMIVAAVCYTIAAAGSLGWAPDALGSWSGALTGALPLAGHAMALAGMMLFARYVVLDVQGLIDHAPKPAKAPKTIKAPKNDADAAPAIAGSTTTAPAKREQAPAAAASRWEEAGDAEEDEESEGDQYLSKSERKRLRKAQQRRAA